MHPFQSEILSRIEIDSRRHEAEQRRLAGSPAVRWSTSVGTLLVAVGDGIHRAGQRLQRAEQARSSCTATPCLDLR
jgi:hypothetical protein